MKVSVTLSLFFIEPFMDFPFTDSFRVM